VQSPAKLQISLLERVKGKDLFEESSIPHQEKKKIIHQEVVRDLEWNDKTKKFYFDKRRVEASSVRRGEQTKYTKTTYLLLAGIIAITRTSRG
jgi:hypothetical protein